MITLSAFLHFIHASYIDTAIACVVLITLGFDHLLNSAEKGIRLLRFVIRCIDEAYSRIHSEMNELREDCRSLRHTLTQSPIVVRKTTPDDRTKAIDDTLPRR